MYHFLLAMPLPLHRCVFLKRCIEWMSEFIYRRDVSPFLYTNSALHQTRETCLDVGEDVEMCIHRLVRLYL